MVMCARVSCMADKESGRAIDVEAEIEDAD